MAGRWRPNIETWDKESKILCINSKDTNLGDKIDDHHFKDAKIEENMREERYSNEYKDGKEALVVVNQEFDINGSEESSSEVIIIDCEDYDSDSSEDSSNNEEESGVNEDAMNNTIKDRCNKCDKSKKVIIREVLFH